MASILARQRTADMLAGGLVNRQIGGVTHVTHNSKGHWTGEVEISLEQQGSGGEEEFRHWRKSNM